MRSVDHTTRVRAPRKARTWGRAAQCPRVARPPLSARPLPRGSRHPRSPLRPRPARRARDPSNTVTVAESEFRMCKKSLRGEQMTDSAYIDDAAHWARELTRAESRGPGDMRNAWSRLERRYGVPARTFWALRYRRPKDLWASVYLRLRAAYEAECARQVERLEHEIGITKALVGTDHAAVAAAEAVVGASVAARAPETVSPADWPSDAVKGEGDGETEGRRRSLDV